MRRFSASSCLLVVALVATACGGGSGSPTTPVTLPTPPPGTPVSGFVFYDENANGFPDAGEEVRLPGVSVLVGGRSATSGPGGAFTVPDVPDGAQSAQLKADGLPPFFLPGAAVPVTAPQLAGPPVALPAVLPIGTNRANRYMGFGDSITAGEGSSDGGGYRSWLEADLAAYWGGGHQVRNEGASGTQSDAGAGRLDGVLARVRPAYTLILYGTNDWNDLDCKIAFPCYTVDSLRSMIRQARDRNSVPVVATITPVNPAFADRAPPERQDWVNRMNDLIRPMVAQEGAVLADLNAALTRAGDLTLLFSDHVHPNDRGYQIIGQAWFRAITTAGGGPGSAFDAESFGATTPLLPVRLPAAGVRPASPPANRRR